MMFGRGKEYHLTSEGVEELKAELVELKQRRLEVAERLKEAKEQLDLTENSDWADAQDESKFIEGRIDEIEHVLRNATIIKSPGKSDAVQLGSKVLLKQNGNKKIEYTIVGSLEANPEAQKISEESPLGKALLGKKIGERVNLTTPAGENAYTVSKIS